MDLSMQPLFLRFRADGETHGGSFALCSGRRTLTEKSLGSWIQAPLITKLIGSLAHKNLCSTRMNGEQSNDTTRIVHARRCLCQKRTELNGGNEESRLVTRLVEHAKAYTLKKG